MAEQLNFLGEGDAPASVGAAPPKWYLAVVEAYNEVAARMKWQIASLATDARVKAARRAMPVYGGLAGWKAGLARAEQSPFLSGKKNGKGHEDWKPSFDFFLQSKSMVKLLEGGYDGRPTAEVVKMEGWREKQAREAREALRKVYNK